MGVTIKNARKKKIPQMEGYASSEEGGGEVQYRVAYFRPK